MSERHIRLQLDDNELTVHYDLRFPADSPLLVPLASGRGAKQPNDLAGQLLGEVRVLQWPLAYSTGPGYDYDLLQLNPPVVRLPP